MNLQKIDGGLKKFAGACLLVGGGSGFSGLFPVWLAVVISFLGVIAGALANSPVFADAAESGWNGVLQGLTAVFAAAAGSSQLEAVQKLIMPAHPALAAKIGLAAMLGAQVFAYLAQRGGGSGPAGPGAVMLLAAFLGVGAVACAPVAAALPIVIAAVQGADIAINMIESFVADYEKSHPNWGEAKIVGEAISKSRVALSVVLDVANGVGDIDQAKLDAAFKDFETAYNDLTSLVGPIGVHVGHGLHATPGGGLMVPSAREIVAAGTRR